MPKCPEPINYKTKVLNSGSSDSQIHTCNVRPVLWGKKIRHWDKQKIKEATSEGFFS